MDLETLQLWSVIGTWVASIGTVSAVIASLWLAYHHGKVKLKVAAGVRQIITSGLSETPDYCMINVVNTGIRLAKITSIYWQVGFFKNKKQMVQMFGYPESEAIPKILAEGEDAYFMLPLRENGDKDDWIVRFSQNLLKENSKIVVNMSLKACVCTSVGQTFETKVEKSLTKAILEQT